MNTPRPLDAHRRNAATWFPGHWGAQPPEAPRALPLPVAYALALGVHRERPPMAGPGYVLYWMTAHELASREVLADGRGSAHLVVGRHTACDAVLAADASIALRHLLIRSSVLDDGCPRLSVLDLETDSGFILPDGTMQRSICAAGPLAFRVGAYSVIALPAGVTPPAQLPMPVCVRDGMPAAPARHALSRITLLPRATLLANRRTLGVCAPLPAEHGRSSGPGYELTLRASCGQVSVQLAAAELNRGLLVGRAPRCLDAGLRPVLNMGISRVHLLLIREGAGCRAYDLASTQGTYEDRRRIRLAPLEDSGTHLALGVTTGIGLSWRASP